MRLWQPARPLSGLAGSPNDLIDPALTWHDLLPHDPCARVDLDSSLQRAIENLDDADTHYGAVVDAHGHFHGVVTRRAIFEALLQAERATRSSVEEQFQGSEARRNALLQVFPDMILVLGRDGRVLDCVAPRGDSLHLSPGKFVGRKIADVMPEGVSAKVMESLARVFERQGIEVCECRLGGDESPANTRRAS